MIIVAEFHSHANAIVFKYAKKKSVMIILISRKAIKGTTIV